MQLFYCHVDIGNFGDDMNAWFWDDFFPDHRDLDPAEAMFGIGSILWKQNLEQFSSILVMGSGTGVGILPTTLPDHLAFGWVRGPMTAERFGLPPEAAITDPAAAVAGMERFRGIESTGRGVFVPHVGTATLDIDWPRIAEAANLDFVHPSEESQSVIARLAAAEFVVTESLHGAIIADAFRRPWYPMAISPKFSSFKWNDWARSIGVELQVYNALGPLKGAYSLLSRARQAKQGLARRIRRQKTDVVAAGASTAKAAQEYSLSSGDKTALRALARSAAGPAERLFIAEIRRAMRRDPFLSADGVVEDRIATMQARIDAVRRGETPFKMGG